MCTAQVRMLDYMNKSSCDSTAWEVVCVLSKKADSLSEYRRRVQKVNPIWLLDSSLRHPLGMLTCLRVPSFCSQMAANTQLQHKL